MPDAPTIDDTNDSAVTYRDCPGLPGYRVGDDGSVWSCLRQFGLGKGRGTRFEIGTAWRRLKPRPNESGHLNVHLGKGRVRLVHRLVLEAFVGPCPPGMEGCHFPDRSPANNRLCNLRWDTKQANAADRDAPGTVIRGEQHKVAKLTAEAVRTIRAEYTGARGQVRRLAERYGVTATLISRVIKGRCWPHVQPA